MNARLETLIRNTIKEGASDLHLSAGHVPTMRVFGQLTPFVNEATLTKEDMLSFLDDFLDEGQKKDFLERKEMDFSFQFNGGVRFRGNAFFQRGGVGVALRIIPDTIPSISDLNLPSVLEAFTRKKQGFFLVVGPVGQGKSTTLASMVELINRERAAHIITIEHPIEYIYEGKKSLIDQREVRLDTMDFHSALRGAFRQDVDVILMGEMRGPETISAAVTAAETGHLVFSTLHTNDAAQTIDRIIDSFPAAQQPQIRIQLAGSLLGIFSQRLLPRVSGGLIPAYELLINNNAISSLIREGKTHEIHVVIETSSRDGMIDMNRSLADLVRRGEVAPEDAYTHSLNPKVLERLL